MVLAPGRGEGGSEEVARFEVGGAHQWNSLVPGRRRNLRCREGDPLGVEHDARVIPGKRWSAGLTNQVDLDEIQRRGKRNSIDAGKSKVVDIVGITVIIGNESEGSVGIVVAQETFATGWLGGGWGGSAGCRGSVAYERRSKRIQLSRPKRMGCCIVPAGMPKPT